MGVEGDRVSRAGMEVAEVAEVAEPVCGLRTQR